MYYTLADIVLLVQCFYYRGFTWKDPDPTQKPRPRASANGANPNGANPNERTALVAPNPISATGAIANGTAHAHHARHDHHDWTNLSPVVPLVPEVDQAAEPPSPLTGLQTVAWNTSIVIMVCAAGVAGWLLARKAPHHHHQQQHHTPADDDDHAVVSFSVLGQAFGYLCAVAYIGSRLPQLVLNHRRRSTDGLSMLFFLFACLGNVTYVLSIVVYMAPCSRRADCAPGEAAAQYGRYILVNLSWLLGSSLTLLLDLCVFAQYFVYIKAEGGDVADDDDECGYGGGGAPCWERREDEIERVERYEGSSWSEDDEEPETRPIRPLLRRGDSTH